MSYNLPGGLQAYTDEMSFELISKAVLQTNISEYLTIRSGLAAGTTAINLLDANINVADRACGWNAAGDLTFTQVDIVMDEKQTKQALCPSDLRDYYLSQKLSATAHAEEVPYEEVVSNLFVEKIKEYNEAYVANAIQSRITVANGAVDSGQTTASDKNTILTDVLDLIDSVPAKADRFGNKAVIMSEQNFKWLRRALVEQDLFNYSTAGNNDMVLEIPGTDYVAVKMTTALVDGGGSPIFPSLSADAMIAGPMEMIVMGVGLESDFDQLKIFYSADNDEVRVMSAWRLGVGVGQVDLFAKNGTL